MRRAPQILAVLIALFAAGAVLVFLSMPEDPTDQSETTQSSIVDGGKETGSTSRGTWAGQGAERSTGRNKTTGKSLPADFLERDRTREEGVADTSEQEPRPPWPVGLTPEDIPPAYERFPQEFLEKLDQIREEPGSPARSSENNIVLFSSSQPHLQIGYPYSDEIFDPSVTRLYAWFPSNNKAFSGRDRVLVKWTGDGVGEVFFEVFSIQPDTEYNYVWFEDGYWAPDRYAVELFGLEEEVPLLAWGTFQIEELSNFVGFPALYNDPDSTGQSLQVFQPDDGIFLRFNFAASSEEQIQIVVRRFSDGAAVYVGTATLPPLPDGHFVGSLEGEFFPLTPDAYFLELYRYAEPPVAVGLNIFTIE